MRDLPSGGLVPQAATVFRAGPGCSQEPDIPSTSPCWVPAAQALGPFLLFSGTVAGSWIWVAGTGTSALTGGITGRALTHNGGHKPESYVETNMAALKFP